MQGLKIAKLAGKLLLVIPLLFLGVTAVMSGQKGNETKGKFYFKQTCKTCHAKGGEGKEVTPMSKTQVQWERYFAAGKHNKGAEPLTKYLTADQLRDVQTFLYNHAVDSPQPETCGK